MHSEKSSEEGYLTDATSQDLRMLYLRCAWYEREAMVRAGAFACRVRAPAAALSRFIVKSS